MLKVRVLVKYEGKRGNRMRETYDFVRDRHSGRRARIEASSFRRPAHIPLRRLCIDQVDGRASCKGEV